MGLRDDWRRVQREAEAFKKDYPVNKKRTQDLAQISDDFDRMCEEADRIYSSFQALVKQSLEEKKLLGQIVLTSAKHLHVVCKYCYQYYEMFYDQDEAQALACLEAAAERSQLRLAAVNLAYQSLPEERQKEIDAAQLLEKYQSYDDSIKLELRAWQVDSRETEEALANITKFSESIVKYAKKISDQAVILRRHEPLSRVEAFEHAIQAMEQAQAVLYPAVSEPALELKNRKRVREQTDDAESSAKFARGHEDDSDDDSIQRWADGVGVTTAKTASVAAVGLFNQSSTSTLHTVSLDSPKRVSPDLI